MASYFLQCFLSLTVCTYILQIPWRLPLSLSLYLEALTQLVPSLPPAVSLSLCQTYGQQKRGSEIYNNLKFRLST